MFTHRLWQSMGIVALLVAAGASPVAAQLPTYGMGRPPAAEEVKAWDLTIPPDGQGLPPGSGTAALGKAIYAERCASCHGEKDVMDAKTLPQVKMPNREGFVPDPRPDVGQASKPPKR